MIDKNDKMVSKTAMESIGSVAVLFFVFVLKFVKSQEYTLESYVITGNAFV